MRHRKSNARLDRSPAQRRALYRSLVTNLFREERISTTLAKAKSMRPIAEKIITTARTDDVKSRRKVAAYLLDKEIVVRLFERIAPRYKARNGGYTRITKLMPRAGDAAKLAVIELLNEDDE